MQHACWPRYYMVWWGKLQTKLASRSRIAIGCWLTKMRSMWMIQLYSLVCSSSTHPRSTLMVIYTWHLMIPSSGGSLKLTRLAGASKIRNLHSTQLVAFRSATLRVPTSRAFRRTTRLMMKSLGTWSAKLSTALETVATLRSSAMIRTILIQRVPSRSTMVSRLTWSKSRKMILKRAWTSGAPIWSTSRRSR